MQVAILGSGNIGTDLMLKIIRTAKHLELAAVAGIDPGSEGLARAKRLGLETTDEGIEGLRRLRSYPDIGIVFDATTARAHKIQAKIVAAEGKRMIDLTPAAIGPFVVPPVNLTEHLLSQNINMVTCGGQSAIPIISAISRVAPVIYAENVASIASKSAGPGMRANIDEFTETTARAIETVGGANRGKAITILNPAEPPLVMRNTVYCLVHTEDPEAVRRSIEGAILEVQSIVPGYRLKQPVQFEIVPKDRAVRIPGLDEAASGLMVSVFLCVEGAGDYLPSYAGNLDIMTASALKMAEHLVEHTLARMATGWQRD